jgi:hypothetical protein
MSLLESMVTPTIRNPLSRFLVGHHNRAHICVAFVGSARQLPFNFTYPEVIGFSIAVRQSGL